MGLSQHTAGFAKIWSEKGLRIMLLDHGLGAMGGEMARISYVDPAAIQEAEIRGWLEEAIRKGKPGPENQAIRAHQPDVMRSFTLTRQWLFHNGKLDHDLKELVRSDIAASLDCKY